MIIIPLKYIREEDKKTIGTSLYNLAKLLHSGVPVIDSVVAIPPSILFEKILNKYLKYSPNIKDYLGNFREEFLNLKMPEGLKNFQMSAHTKKQSHLTINISRLWITLLQKWCNELISKIERGEKQFREFTPQLVIYPGEFKSQGKGYFDEDREHIVIKTEKGRLSNLDLQKIENIILQGNKKLLLPQVYDWVLDKDILKIIKVSPYTQSLGEETLSQNGQPEVKPENPLLKTATKIFLDFRDEALTQPDCDGIFLRILNPHPDEITKTISSIEKFHKNIKFFFYPEFDAHSDNVLEFAKSLIFFRNKKKLDAQIVLPVTYSIDQFLNLKREYASFDIYSKGTLKIWKEFRNISDFLNVEDYLDAGFDGALINLDEIAKLVTGVSSEKILSQPKLDWIISIEKFLKELGLPKLTKNNKPILVAGKLLQSEELLNYLIKFGVWGLIFETNSISGIREHVRFLERQALGKLITVEIKH